LMVSFLMVVINSLVLIHTRRLVRGSRSWHSRRFAQDNRLCLFVRAVVPQQYWYSAASPRAPPLSSRVSACFEPERAGI
jgi:hypothetical protein